VTATKDDTRVLTNQNCCEIEYDAIIAACKGENYTMSLVGRDADVVIKAVNIGIDSRLQACNCPDRGDDYGQGKRSIIASERTKFWEAGEELVLANTLECSISPESLCVLLRRLFEDMEYTGEDDDDCDVGWSVGGDILMTLGFNDCGKFVGREALGLD